MPHISSSIILAAHGCHSGTDRLFKEGEQGRKKINQYTRYGTIVISLVVAFFIARWLEGNNRSFLSIRFRWCSTRLGFETTMFSPDYRHCVRHMWLGEQITERAATAYRSSSCRHCCPLPLMRWCSLFQKSAGQGDLTMSRAVPGRRHCRAGYQRHHLRSAATVKIPVQYAKRVVGRKVYGGQSTHLP